MNGRSNFDGKVKISMLKEFAIKELEDPLKSLILAESNELEIKEFITKVQTWLKLLDIQKHKKKSLIEAASL